MLSERIQSNMVRILNSKYLSLAPTKQTHLTAPRQGQSYMLYAHIPFCERLCPYCSFNRYLFEPNRATSYFDDLRSEMQMLAELGYDFESLYIGGGTPTVMPGELYATIDEARRLFSIDEVSCETNPNHLTPEILSGLDGRVQRLSCGVQSFDDDLLRQMERYEKYGSGLDILTRVQAVHDRFDSFNIDMIFNFPSQSEDVLINDLAAVLESGANQVTFYPLMASPAVAQSLARTVGRVDYGRERHYYEIISEVLTGGNDPDFTFGSAWTFNRIAKAAGKGELARGELARGEVAQSGEAQGKVVQSKVARGEAARGEVVQGGEVQGELVQSGVMRPVASKAVKAPMIDEYIIDYEEYPAIGSGGLSYLDGSLFVNTFSLQEYHERIQAGQMSVSGQTNFSKYDRMRYRFMMQLFGLRLDKQQWLRDFGCSVVAGIPAEYLFFKAIGAIDHENDIEITLNPKGRYMMVAMMRQFFIGVNGVRDQARANLSTTERELLFGE